MAINKKLNAARANLAHSQGLLDRLHAAPAEPQEMAQQSPEMEQPGVESPQETPQLTPVEQPAQEPQKETPKEEPSEISTLETEAERIKELNDTIGGGFEAVSKLADAMKEVAGVKKSITKRIREKLTNEKPEA